MRVKVQEWTEAVDSIEVMEYIGRGYWTGTVYRTLDEAITDKTIWRG